MKINKIIFLIVSCVLIVDGFSQTLSSGGEADRLSDRSYLNEYFKEASMAYNIPVEILQGIGFVESHWIQRIPVEDGDTPPSYGVMGLRDDEYFGRSLINASEISGLSVISLKSNARDNILGAAALLSEFKKKDFTNKGYNLEDWNDAVQKYCGIPQPKLARLYAYDVFAVINSGFQNYGILINKKKIDPALLVDPLLDSNFNNSDVLTSLQTGYPGAVWTPAASGNYGVSNRPTAYAINKIIIHDTEGSFASAVSWFQNSSSGVSAQYVVRSSDGYIVQMVDDKDIGYHAGNLSYNQTSVGIEVEGYVTDPSYFSSAAYNSVKNICTWECNQWEISKTRTSIIGHNQVPDPIDATLWGGAGHHNDPGGAWDWDTFIQSVSGVISVYQPLQINTASLNVRTGPGVGSPLLTTLALNQKFVSYYTDPSSGWYLIFLPGGNSLHYDGWISNAYAAPDNCAAQVKVTGAWPTMLKVRSGPSTSYAIIDQVADNQIFVASSTASGWYDYFTGASSNAANGWSSGSYLQLYDPCNIITQTNQAELTDAAIKIYPNPASDKVFIELPISSNMNFITVCDPTGRIVSQQNTVSSISEMDISQLAKGVYFIRLNINRELVIIR
ncbi:MAG: N-acetylmuramoyl-L-alanine amidase, partial [Bacteroidota bacterium]